ncbi:MAG: hypothetical protein GC181_09630 [Bacteroidetes bacterium]|nr:hypothetical protein [Bacteroidota bacterium]
MRIFPVLIFCLCFNLASAQDYDSVVNQREWAQFLTYKDVSNFQFKTQTEDTALDFVHRVLPLKQNQIAWQHPGPYYSPYRILEFSLPATDHFQVFPGVMNVNHLQSENIRFYSSRYPRTDLKYSQGGDGLLFIKAEHSQNISKNWLVGLNYVRNRVQNRFYQNMAEQNLQRMTNTFSAQLFTRFRTENLKYEVLADYTWNKSKIQETGGITNSAEFDSLNSRQRRFGGTAYLSDAQNQFLEKSIHLVQMYRDGSRKVKDGDTLVTDTTYNNIKSQWVHEFYFRNNQYRFTDDAPNEELYPVRNISLKAFDSVRCQTISNSLHRMGLIKGNGRYDIAVEHELIRVLQLNGYTSVYSNVHVIQDWKIAIGRLKLRPSGNWTVNGYNKGDWNLKFAANSSIGKAKIKASLTSIRKRPDYNYQFYVSNYYWWFNDLAKTNYQSLDLFIGSKGKKLSLEPSVTVVQGYVYLNESGDVEQNSSTFLIQKVKAIVLLNLGKKWRWNNELLYQKSGSDVWRTPDFSAHTNLFVEGKLFHGNMFARIGAEAWWMSSFKGYTYDPALRNYKLSSTAVGGFPQADVYVDMHVSTVKLFVLVENISQGNFKSDWFLQPAYPMIGRVIRFGVQWRLSN